MIPQKTRVRSLDLFSCKSLLLQKSVQKLKPIEKNIQTETITLKEIKNVRKKSQTSAIGKGLTTGNNYLFKEEKKINKEITEFKESTDVDVNKSKQVDLNNINKNIFGVSKIIDKLLLQSDVQNKNTKKTKSEGLFENLFKYSNLSKEKLIPNHLSWSQIISELFLTTFIRADDYEYSDSIYIWNANYQSGPEFQLKCNSPVNKAIFSLFNQEIIYAGLENGRICMFDLRHGNLPVCESQPGFEKHRSPIIDLHMSGSRNSYNIISIEEYGCMGVWSPNLDQFKRMDLFQISNKEKTDEILQNIEPTCLSFIYSESNNIFLGSTDGKIYNYSLLKSGEQNNKNSNAVVFNGHQSYISSISFNNSKKLNSKYSNYFLSGSMDWSIKVWNFKQGTNWLHNICVHKDMITDISWNNGVPSVFASSSNDGVVNIFNIEKQLSSPIETLNVNVPVINCKFNKNGNMLALTTDDGEIEVKRVNLKNLN